MGDDVMDEITVRDWFAIHAPEAPKWFINEYVERSEFALDAIEDTEMKAHIAWKWHYADLMIFERDRT